MAIHSAPDVRLDLSVDLAPGQKHGLPLRNPVMTASGTFGNAIEFAHLVDVQRLGAIVSKGLTLRPRSGNPTPRTVETPAGMLNSIGLQNIGVDALVRDVAPVWATWDTPAIVNISADRIDDYVELATRLDGVPGVAALEVNISCPNVDNGLEFGCVPEGAAAVTAAVRPALLPAADREAHPEHGRHRSRGPSGGGRRRRCALRRQHAPRDGDRRAEAAAGAGARPRRPLGPRDQAGDHAHGLGRVRGGAGADRRLRRRRRRRGCARVPEAGATAVQVGTAMFREPGASLRVLDELEALLRAQGAGSVAEIVGVAHGKLNGDGTLGV